MLTLQQTVHPITLQHLNMHQVMKPSKSHFKYLSSRGSREDIQTLNELVFSDGTFRLIQLQK